MSDTVKVGSGGFAAVRAPSRLVDASPSPLVTDFVSPDAAPAAHAPAAAGVRREVDEADSTRISPTAIRLSLGASNIGQASAQPALSSLLESSAVTGAIDSLRQYRTFTGDGVNDGFRDIPDVPTRQLERPPLSEPDVRERDFLAVLNPKVAVKRPAASESQIGKAAIAYGG